jgi:hypothetical protein
MVLISSPLLGGDEKNADTRPAPPLAPQKARFGRGAVGSSCCYAMHRLTTHSRWPGPAPGGIATRASFHYETRSTRPGCQLATHPRRREAAGRSVDRASLLVPPLRRRVVGDGFLNRTRSKRPFSAPPGPSAGVVFRIGAATHTHVAL